jgi:sialic acid synthase SpsE
MNRMRNLFGRSWALKEDKPIGTRLSREMLTLKKPATGFQVHELERLLGKVLSMDKSHLDLIHPSDLNEA